ncbi:MAG: ankyrin repeat domain-containing protein [Epsilonproteobacteria bacterium]|nr:ankyrin repeat domain-containing protein [Campylobacterota bacterium]
MKCSVIFSCMLLFACSTLSAMDEGQGVDLDRASLALHEAAQSDSLDDAKKAVGDGADVNARNEHGLTPLHNAVCHNSLGVMTYLLSLDGVEKNAKVVATRKDGGHKGTMIPFNGYTTLHLAIVNLPQESEQDVEKAKQGFNRLLSSLGKDDLTMLDGQKFTPLARALISCQTARAETSRSLYVFAAQEICKKLAAFGLSVDEQSKQLMQSIKELKS